jgi:magnesium chelatase family protein
MEFPACFQLVAAMNPCPCGFAGDQHRACRCGPDRVSRYQGRISGPFLDRIDLSLSLQREPLPDSYLEQARGGESSAAVGRRVAAARARQRERSDCLNARLRGDLLRRYCRPDKPGRQLLARAVERLSLSARACDSALRVARTIADIDAEVKIREVQISEALSLRTSNSAAVAAV